MFSIDQIEAAHARVKSGADFPRYIQEIKLLGVRSFETWVQDSHTVYFGEDGFTTQSGAMYANMTIATSTDAGLFQHCLKIHQQGLTDYFTFCADCARSGIVKWCVDLTLMSCTYYDQSGLAVWVESVPSV